MSRPSAAPPPHDELLPGAEEVHRLLDCAINSHSGGENVLQSAHPPALHSLHLVEQMEQRCQDHQQQPLAFKAPLSPPLSAGPLQQHLSSPKQQSSYRSSGATKSGRQCVSQPSFLHPSPQQTPCNGADHVQCAAPSFLSAPCENSASLTTPLLSQQRMPVATRGMPKVDDGLLQTGGSPLSLLLGSGRKGTMVSTHPGCSLGCHLSGP